MQVTVWDPMVRISHWTVAFLVIGELIVIEEDWAIHRWAGYAVLFLVTLRLVWGVIGTRHARFTAFPPSLGAARTQAREVLAGRHRLFMSHNPLGALMAYNLWAALIAVCVTGIMLTLDRFWGVGWVEEVHEIIANWILVSVLLHVGGVAFDGWRSKVNLVRAMITGVKEVPGPDA